MPLKLWFFWIAVAVIAAIMIWLGAGAFPSRVSIIWLIGGAGFFAMTVFGVRADLRPVQGAEGIEYQKHLRMLEKMIADGTGETDEAEKLRQKMDALWLIIPENERNWFNRKVNLLKVN